MNFLVTSSNCSVSIQSPSSLVSNNLASICLSRFTLRSLLPIQNFYKITLSATKYKFSSQIFVYSEQAAFLLEFIIWNLHQVFHSQWNKPHLSKHIVICPPRCLLPLRWLSHVSFYHFQPGVLFCCLTPIPGSSFWLCCKNLAQCLAQTQFMVVTLIRAVTCHAFRMLLHPVKCLPRKKMFALSTWLWGFTY